MSSYPLLRGYHGASWINTFLTLKEEDCFLPQINVNNLDYVSLFLRSCNEVASSYPSCNATTVLAGYHGSGSGGSPGDGGVITGADVIREYGGVYPLYVCFLAMLGFSVLYRLLAYLSLRHLHRHAH